MESTRTFLAILLVIGLNLNRTAGGSSANWEDLEKSSAVWANKEFSFSSEDQQWPELFRLLKSAAQQDEATVGSNTDNSTAGNNRDNSTSDGGWMAQCDNLSDDLEKSWNLTVVVAEANWPVVESVAETLYAMILDCTQGNVLKEAECLVKNLGVLRTILVPAVKMNLGYVQQAWRLIPEFVTAAKECFTF